MHNHKLGRQLILNIQGIVINIYAYEFNGSIHSYQLQSTPYPVISIEAISSVVLLHCPRGGHANENVMYFMLLLQYNDMWTCNGQ